MLEINRTFLIQLGFFLAFMVIVNTFLFKPMRHYLARRQRTIENLRATAGSSDAQLAELSAQYSRRITTTKDEILAKRAAARKEALEWQKTLLDEAKRQAVVEIDAAEDELAKEVEAARAHLSSQSEALATVIAAKVLGRAS